MTSSRRSARIALVRAAMLASLPFALVPAAARGQGEMASVSGTVRDSGGRPIGDAEVGVLGAGIRVHTDAAGAYRIPNLLVGRATVTARRLGFIAGSRSVRLLAGDNRLGDFVLVAAAQSLETVPVVAERNASDARLAGFNARRLKQVGHFVTRERIDRANSATLVDVLREVPGMRIGGQGSEGRLVRIRSSTCPPLIFIDGVPASAGEFDLDMIDVQTVEGIEVYSGLGSLPPEFSGPRDLDRCGVIAIWSRPSRSRRAAPPPAAAAAAPADTGVYRADQVDVAARPDSGAVGPAYPDSLYRAGVGGRVVVEAIVDTTGRVEPASVTVLEASDARFAEPARAAVLRAAFQPALRAGRRVRQVVRLPFVFTAPRAGMAAPPPF